MKKVYLYLKIKWRENIQNAIKIIDRNCEKRFNSGLKVFPKRVLRIINGIKHLK
jgi:hypothetical protein